jgi:hypothetical protein
LKLWCSREYYIKMELKQVLRIQARFHYLRKGSNVAKLPTWFSTALFLGVG